MNTDLESNNLQKPLIDDTSPESLMNALQNTVEQSSDTVKEVGIEDNTINRELIQDTVAEMFAYLIYTILVNILAIAGSVLSIFAVSTCRFMKIKNDSPWFGLLGWGRHQWEKECKVHFQDPRCEEYDLEDYFEVAARIFGKIAAVVGLTIAVWTIISISTFPRRMKVVLTTSSFSNVLFQGLVFLIYGGEVCQEDKYCSYNHDKDKINGKGCEFSSGAVCAVIAMLSWLVLGILFIFRKPFSSEEAKKKL